jgi:hypothetical protein
MGRTGVQPVMHALNTVARWLVTPKRKGCPKTSSGVWA